MYLENSRLHLYVGEVGALGCSGELPLPRNAGTSESGEDLAHDGILRTGRSSEIARDGFNSLR